MIVCGIDPGYNRAGYGFLKVEKQKCEVLSYGLISTSKTKNFDDRILELGNDFSHLFAHYKPTHVFMEKLFMGKNVTTVLQVAEVRGIIRYLVNQNGIIMSELAPTSIKKNISGYGRADKNQMIRAITMLLNLAEPPSPDDVADALSIAFCGYLKIS